MTKECYGGKQPVSYWTKYEGSEKVRVENNECLGALRPPPPASPKYDLSNIF
jgi:hypothetical protein